MEVISVLAKLLVTLAVLIWWVVQAVFQVVKAGTLYILEYTPVVTRRVRQGVTFVLQLVLQAVRTSTPLVIAQAQYLNIQAKTVASFAIKHLNPRFGRLPLQLPTPGAKRTWLSKLSLAGMAVTFVMLFFLIFPDFALSVLPYQREEITSAVDSSVLGGSFDDGNLYSEVDLPEKNEYLPTGHWLTIPKIGVMTQIYESSTEDHEQVLRKGVWRVPDFADPTQKVDYPSIFVAHKFGYLSWSNQYRRQNSFYNLEKLQKGDTFEVIWDQRKFVYEIYAGDQGKEISDYDADVILYTCKYLNSPIRIFRYARRVEY